MGIANEQAAHTLLLAKGDDFAGAFVAQVSDLAALARAHLAPSGPQLARPPRAGLTALALPRQVSERHVVPPLERTNPPPRHHQRHARVGGHRRLVDFTKGATVA
jgi:hypothetical protein